MNCCNICCCCIYWWIGNEWMWCLMLSCGVVKREHNRECQTKMICLFHGSLSSSPSQISSQLYMSPSQVVSLFFATYVWLKSKLQTRVFISASQHWPLFITSYRMNCWNQPVHRNVHLRSSSGRHVLPSKWMLKCKLCCQIYESSATKAILSGTTNCRGTRNPEAGSAVLQ